MIWLCTRFCAYVQLFMITNVREYILAAEGAADESIEAEEMEEKPENEVPVVVCAMLCSKPVKAIISLVGTSSSAEQ